MKLRVRINKQTSRVDLPGEEPTLTELSDVIKQTLLTSTGLGLNTEFSLSLNGSELLLDSGQTLSSFGIVSGDLICVLLRQPPAVAVTSGETSSTAPITDDQQTATQRPLGPPLLTEPLHTSDELDSGPVWEPMLCSEAEEGQSPLSLELLYHSARVWSPNDAVIVAAHLLMLETGFTPQGNELTAEEMPAGWRSVAGVHKLEYVHPLCGTSQVSVVAVSMGPLLIINAALTLAGTIYSVHKLQLNASSYVTDEWPGETTFKNAVVQPLLKKPGLDQSDCANYRPISKLPFISKVIQKLALTQLTSRLDDDGLLDPFQSGFRRNHSTKSAHIRVLNDILILTDSGSHVLLLLLDLTAAFNTVDLTILLHRLAFWVGVTGTALEWLKSYLNHRCFSVHVGDCSSPNVPLPWGVPQSSILKKKKKKTSFL
uniref:F-box protein 7 n=1 Tax=Nothobranchius furzeri TaxID=105023 RepID=A0A1A8AR94_NOTFU